MGSWKKSRNYRRIKDENGIVIANLITVNGVEIEVSTEVFDAYSAGDRHERYQEEQRDAVDEVSLESLTGDGVPLELYLMEHSVSAEQALLDYEDVLELEAQCVCLRDALASMSDEDRNLLHALFFEGVSTRAYAKQIGVVQRTVIKRRNRILQDLKKYFKKFS